jgi:hypothetical protein
VARTLTTGLPKADFDFTWQDGSKEETLLATNFGTYSVTVQNECGVVTQSITFSKLVDSEELTLDLGQDVTVCDEESHLLNAGQAAAGKSFIWSTGATTPTITATISGTYSVEVSQGCSKINDSVKVSFMETPPDFSLGDDELTCSLVPKTLTSPVSNQDFNLTWQDGSNGNSFLVSEFGLYWLKAENACGMSVDTIRFSQKPIGDFKKIKHYNFISPDNNDHFNEYFVLDDLFLGSSLTIYNRAGKIMYHSSNYHNDWDGGGLANGVYFFTIRGECFGEQKGSITIVN